MSSSRQVPSGAELDSFAKLHLHYEVSMLVEQAVRFHERYPQGMPASGEFTEPITDDALLEACLVHLRLLDDFIHSRDTYDSDARAEDWVPKTQWSATVDWLPKDVRDRINWQVAHMSLSREPWFDWRIRDYAHACCEQVVAFVNAAVACDPDRGAALQSVVQMAREGLTKLAPIGHREAEQQDALQ